MKISIIRLAFLLITISFVKLGPFSGSQWTSRSATDKLNLLFNEVVKNVTQQSFMSQQDFESIFYNEDMTPTFNLEQEELPPGRVKTVHQVGLMARCVWQVSLPEAAKYTGIFQGADNCLLRFNLAHNPDFDAFVPALSIKLLRDGFRSANLVLSGNMNGQTSHNFFENPLSNHPEIPTHSRFADHFSTGISLPYISSIGLQKWATHDQHGNTIPDQNANFPFDVKLLPSDALKNAYQEGQPWYQQIISMYPGTFPYFIYARQDPNSNYEMIAALGVLDQPMFSYFGDNVYFVKHNDVSDDLRMHPEYAQYLQTYYVNNRKTDSAEFLNDRETDSAGKPGCPFL